MLSLVAWDTLLGLTIVGAPAALTAVLGAASFVSRPLRESTVSRLVGSATLVGFGASAAMLAGMLARGAPHATVELGHWVDVPGFHFSIRLLFDYLSMTMVLLSYVLCGVISAFASRYLHREAGYHRFFVLYSLFVLGMVTASLAGTIETLFMGWELVGLSSALLVAFYHERPAPVRNGLRVWVVYRASDAALLTAALVLHHLQGQGDFDLLFGHGDWTQGHATLPVGSAVLVGLLLLFAAAGKSALIPFSGWLPRAMEGPTPSSAVFYGALSVHLGAYLLLRVSPLLEVSPWLAWTTVALGLSTAVFAALTARVQTDIKSALSFASLTQVGLIVAEIGLGLRWIPLVHLVGHACFRTLQFLRAPSLLQDYRLLENALGERLPGASTWQQRWISDDVRNRLYGLMLERGYLDALLDQYVVGPTLKAFKRCDAWERRWTDLLAGKPSRQSDAVRPVVDVVEEWT